MREIAIVISDLYLAPTSSGNSPERAAGDGRAVSGLSGESLPGLRDIARFGDRKTLDEGWRPWLARWLGRDDLAGVAPATIATAARRGASGAVIDGEGGGRAWFATPVHLIPGLTSVHLDRRGILKLSAADLSRFAHDFAQAFGDSEFVLETSNSGIFIMRSRDSINAHTTEPARAVVSDLQTSLPTGPNAPALRRLGAELEIWLHAHPVNQQRASHGDLPVSTLWFWGGGSANSPPTARAPVTHEEEGPSALGLGDDAYLSGLWQLQGLQRVPLPERLPDFASYPHARKVALVAEVTPLLQMNPNWTMLEALSDLDRRFITPAIAELRASRASSVLLIANDVQLRLGRRDNLKFWRRRPTSGIDALSHPVGGP